MVTTGATAARSTMAATTVATSHLHRSASAMVMDKGKEVVSPLDKGKEVVPPLVEVSVHEHPNAKQWNYGHYHEEAGPTHFCKVIFAPKLEALPLPLDFTKHFTAVPIEFGLKTNTDYSWRVTVKVVDGRVTIDQGWATFVAVHQVMIGYLLTFKLLTPNNMKVFVFNDNGVEVVTKCKKHDEAFAVTA